MHRSLPVRRSDDSFLLEILLTSAVLLRVTVEVGGGGGIIAGTIRWWRRRKLKLHRTDINFAGIIKACEDVAKNNSKANDAKEKKLTPS